MFAIKDKVEMAKNADWSGKRVIVIGAARQGIALARYLVRNGAQVVINDRLPITQLTSAQEALAEEPIEWNCGGHPFSLLDDADLVCISGGVPIDLPIVREAQLRGIEITNDSQIFLEVCPCRVIGITGSAGKTTTTILVGLIAQAAIEELGRNAIRNQKIGNVLEKDSDVWVGGNIGSPLLSRVDKMKPTDLAVMELSSFQLEVMYRSPEIAAILNITPNHLDRHKTMQAYSSAKARILQFQTPQDIAVLNQDDPGAWGMKDLTKGRLVTFSTRKSSGAYDNVFFDSHSNSINVEFKSAEKREEIQVIDRDEIPMRGDHNLHNVMGACAISWAAELPVSAMVSGIKRFSGIPHRLEFVRTWGGGEWYNDSIATAPERAIAAINSFTEPMILLAGGKDKNLPWDGFAYLVCQRVKHLILFGEAAGIISDAVARHQKGSELTVTYCSGLKEAVLAAADKISDGDVVLLAPGGTSFDEFRDFEDRGEAYKKWVMELQ
jgi:UDP-N-acetylmuramoylalanine--D-glutamate ligase